MATTNLSCAAEGRSFTYSPPELFEDTRIIVAVHEVSPRFGHSSEISNLFTQGTNNEGGDYLRGLLASSIAIFAFFLVWMIVILSLWCAGYDKVGFFSGHRVVRPTPPLSTTDQEKEDSDVNNKDEEESDESIQKITKEPKEDRAYQDQNAWEKKVAKRKRRLRRIRITVLFCGLCIIICVILMCVKGAMSLDRALDDGRDGLSQAKSLAQGAIDIIDDYTITQNATIQKTLDLGNNLNGLCPNVTNVICQDIMKQEGCDFSDIPYAKELEAYLEQGRDYVFDALVDIRSDLGKLINILNDADQVAAKFHWAFYVSAAFAGVVGLLTALIMTGVVLAWREDLKGEAAKNKILAKIRSCVHNVLLVPVYSFFVALSWIFSMVFVIGSIATADTCVGSPDDRMVDVLSHYEDDFTSAKSLIYVMAKFYLSGCPQHSIPALLKDHLKVVFNFLVTLVNLIGSFSGTRSQTFESVCGTDPNLAIDAVETFYSQVCLLALILVETQNYFSCDNWHPLYATAMYNAVCYEGNEGFAYIATMQFLIVFFAMIMLTLRVAFYEMEDEKQAKSKPCARCCCSCPCESTQEDGGSLKTAKEDDRVLETATFSAGDR